MRARLIAISMVVGCLGLACSSSESATPAVLGATCSIDADCGGRMTCRKDTSSYLANGQCMAPCDAESDCAGLPGNEPMCIGAQICAARCAASVECPLGTICSRHGWCQRTGPGSGNKYCAGTPRSCVGLSASTCSANFWCSDHGKCSGAAGTNCTLGAEFTCTASGCTWTPDCRNALTTCDGLSVSGCTSVSGCFVAEG